MATPLIGRSEGIERIRELINHVADTGLNVIITGESGVGKEVVAQNLSFESSRKDKPFIKVNCAAIPDGLLESELFGFERGAFTGADRNKRGIFELAHQGVIFLDEIGDMSLSLQSKLLHVLQSGEFSPLGSERNIRSDAWFIASTNRELKKKVKEGLFREDLYYRLTTIKIHIPPLRNRSEDIPLLIDYYIKKYASQFDGKNISKPDIFSMERLMSYSWPGNVRELQNILKNCIVIGNWEKIIDDLYLENRSVSTSRSEEQVLEGNSIVDVLLNYKGEYYSDLESFSLNKIKKKAIDRIEKEDSIKMNPKDLYSYAGMLTPTAFGVKKESNWQKKYIEHFLYDLPKTNKVLEIGPGTGGFAEECINRNWQYLGVEPSVIFLKTLKSKNIGVINTRVPPIPVRDESFNLIHAAHVIEHFLNIKEFTFFLSECHRCLEKEGILSLTCPNSMTQGKLFYYFDYTHRLPFTKFNLERALFDYGFRILRSHSYLQWLLSGNIIVNALRHPIIWFAKFINIPIFSEIMDRVNSVRTLRHRITKNCQDTLTFIATKYS